MPASPRAQRPPRTRSFASIPRHVATAAALTLAPLLTPHPCPASAPHPVTGLHASARHGQIFLTWAEAATPEGTTFSVYVSDRPIRDLTGATRVARHIEQHSARDWWEDPASFDPKATPAPPVGFQIAERQPRLDPSLGLFVFTRRPGPDTATYFAVTSTGPDGAERREIVPGQNSLLAPVHLAAESTRPIWQGPRPAPAPGVGEGKALSLELHAKGGVIAHMEYLMFGDSTMGWREGLAFKFSVRREGDTIVLRPTDRVWINRPHLESSDGGARAIWTFWYGYNSTIDDRAAMRDGVPTNYTERRLLWMLDWVHAEWRTASNRTTCHGSSMGGCGTLSFGLRHPERFAALHAHVPIARYNYLGTGILSAGRLEPCCWIGPIPPDLLTNEGIPLLERMDAPLLVKGAQTDLPPLHLVHGRKDGSIPWVNNPPFYRALTKARQGFRVYWDNGDHATCGRDAPADVKAWLQMLGRYRLDESFPAFTNTSSDRDPGDGDPARGDLVGWINRGMDWSDIEDAHDHYTITLRAAYPGLGYPVRTDVTIRWAQRFHPGPNTRLQVSTNGGDPRLVTSDPRGLITIPDVTIPSPAGIRFTIRN